MWPLYLLVSKFLKTEEENFHGSDGDHSSMIDPCSFKLSSSNGQYHAGILPRSHSVEVPHINQLCNWDCGLACVLMVLRTIGINNCNIQALEELCCTTSIWTVDLAYLMQQFSIKFSYFTVTLGANPKFSVETFYKYIKPHTCKCVPGYPSLFPYLSNDKSLKMRSELSQKGSGRLFSCLFGISQIIGLLVIVPYMQALDQLPNDLVRVDMLFRNAVDAGVDIQFRSISEEEISLFVLSGEYIAIALVDQYKLRHSWLDDMCISSFSGGTSGYTGHYVVICGYDADSDEFEIRDPASSRKFERVTSKCLEEARKSFGTDEDLLLISLEKNRFQKNPSIILSPQVDIDP